MSESFFDQLAASGTGWRRPRSTRDEPAIPVESLRQSLHRILNSRHGMCEACPDYGLPFLGDLALSKRDLRAALAHAIGVAVTKYEPRFTRVWVTPVAEEDEPGLTLTFRIEGACGGNRPGSRPERVWYEARLTPEGRFEVGG